MLADDDTSNISAYGRETYLGHYPSGSSLRNLKHFRQIIKSGRFEKYDFGAAENQKRYG